MLTALIVCIIALIRLGRQVDRLNDRIFLAAGLAAEADTSGLPPAEMSPHIQGGMVTRNRIDIGGRADENWILSLSIDDRVDRVTLPQQGRFSFDGVLLRRGQNKIEVRALHPSGEVHVLQSLTLTYGPPLLSHLARDLSRGPLDRKEVALTFDGGSMDNIAGEILDLLDGSGVKATFFLTGEFIRKYPKTVMRIAEEGHMVGNHTWSHPHLTTYAENSRHETLPSVSAGMIRQELEKTAALYKRVTGKEMSPIWRAPYGEYNPEILGWAAQAGYRHVGWTTGRGWRESMDTADWVADKTSSIYRTSEEILGKILEFARRPGDGANGAIILMHLGSERTDDFPHRKLPEMVSGLRGKGYELVIVADMLDAD